MFKKIKRTFRYVKLRQKFRRLGVEYPTSGPFAGKVILPVIRQVVPNVLASDLVNVQPMSEEVGEIFKWNEDTKDDT